jgi:hypothetical protein
MRSFSKVYVGSRPTNFASTGCFTFCTRDYVSHLSHLGLVGGIGGREVVAQPAELFLHLMNDIGRIYLGQLTVHVNDNRVPPAFAPDASAPAIGDAVQDSLEASGELTRIDGYVQGVDFLRVRFSN